MLIYYGSFAYFMYIILPLALCAGLYFLFRKKSYFAKRILVISIASLNLLQHLMKPIIYPQYFGTGFSYLESAYNMCAFLIIISPFVILFGSTLMRDFLTYLGTTAGMIAILVPYWFIGQSAFQWEAYRFYLCHSLLFASSILPSLLGLHKIKFRNFYKIGFVFFFALIMILFNDTVFVALGLYPETDINDLFASLSLINPCWCMHPPEGFGWLSNMISALSPNIFLGNADGKIYIPILWYAVPMYILITFIAFVLGAIFDRDGFNAFISYLKNAFSKAKALSKEKFKKENKQP